MEVLHGWQVKGCTKQINEDSFAQTPLQLLKPYLMRSGTLSIFFPPPESTLVHINIFL